MTIPDYQSLMLPLLKAVSDGKQHKISNLYEALSDEFKLTETERNERLPSGRETYIKNRVSWARTYIKKANLVSSPGKGLVQITTAGKELLSSNPKEINNAYLRRYPDFVEFRPRESDRKSEEIIDLKASIDATPLENLESSYNSLQNQLAEELLDTIKQSDPFFFEQLVIDLMLALGYGGSRKNAGEATKKSGDGGIDGVIREDILGLDTIYLQAKRYTKEVIGAPKLREFAGALQEHKARKGVFITTSTFSSAAENYVTNIDSKIILINGFQLSKLMIEYDVGVSKKDTFEIKQIDSDYFAEN